MSTTIIPDRIGVSHHQDLVYLLLDTVDVTLNIELAQRLHSKIGAALERITGTATDYLSEILEQAALSRGEDVLICWARYVEAVQTKRVCASNYDRGLPHSDAYYEAAIDSVDQVRDALHEALLGRVAVERAA